jgi:hypothetical protein
MGITTRNYWVPNTSTKQVKSCNEDTLNATAGAITMFGIVDVQLLLSVTRMVCVPTLANENVVDAELIAALPSSA